MDCGHLTMEDLYFIRVDKGEDVAATVQQAVTELGIQQGVFLCGIGVLGRANVYEVVSDSTPSQRNYDVLDQVVEVCAIQGNIIEGAVHMHAVLSTGERAYAGHVEPGNVALIPIQIIVASMGGDRLRRKRVDGRNHIVVEKAPVP